MNPFTHGPSPDFLSETFAPEEWTRSRVLVNGRWYYYELGHHFGYDGGHDGDPIYVVGPGVIVASGFPSGAFGNRATIRLDNGLFFHNNHMREAPLIRAGTPVKGGETIGHVGATGHVGGPHNHKTMTRENRFAADVMVDPGPWLRELQEALKPMTAAQMKELKDYIDAKFKGLVGDDVDPAHPNDIASIKGDTRAIRAKLGA